MLVIAQRYLYREYKQRKRACSSLVNFNEYQSEDIPSDGNDKREENKIIKT